MSVHASGHDADASKPCDILDAQFHSDLLVVLIQSQVGPSPDAQFTSQSDVWAVAASVYCRATDVSGRSKHAGTRHK